MAARPLTTVVLAPDAVSAGLVHRRITERLRVRLGAPPVTRPHVRRLRAGLGEGSQSWWARLALAARPHALVVEHDLAGWAARALVQPGGLPLVWLRPGLLAMHPALDRTWTGPDETAWRELLAFDVDLEGVLRLPLEALCAGGPELDSALDAALGVAPDEPDDDLPGAPADPDAYARTLRALAPPRALGADLRAAYAPPGAGTHPVTLDGSGLRLLGQGWGAPEPHYVWNEGRLSTLLIPPEPEGRGWIVRVGGFMVVHPERTITVTARLDGAVLDSAQTRPGQRSDFSLTLLMPPSATGAPQVVELGYEGIVRPEEMGAAGDVRALACALREIRLETRSARIPSSRAAAVVAARPSPAGSPPPAARGDGLVGDPALREVLEGADLGPVLVIAHAAAVADAAEAAAVAAGREVRRVQVADTEGLRGGIEGALAELHTLGDRVGAVLLADEAAFPAWFAVAREEFRAGVFEAALVLATGDPERCPPEFLQDDPRRQARLEVSDLLVVRRR